MSAGAATGNGPMRSRRAARRARSGLQAWLLVLLLAGCGTGTPTALAPAALADAFPDADAVPGWAPAGDLRRFDSESIFQLVNGQADAFFVYGFQQVGVQDYENDAGDAISVEIWQLATPADAYGLFTANSAGAPTDIGNDGDIDPGRRLAFWQHDAYVHVRARQAVDDAVLRAFAEAVSAALPGGGERPAVMDRLPPENLVERSTVFFHEELSIQSYLWLGGQNLLGLSPETDAVLARYELGGQVVQLLLVQYPDAAAAAAGLAALGGAQMESLAAAEASGALLGAVFGSVDAAAAGGLLEQAMSDR